MKIYTLTIVYNDKDEEDMVGTELAEYLNEDEDGPSTSFNIVGEA